MIPYLEFIFMLLHIIGLMIFGGGHIWFAVLTTKAKNNPGNPLPPLISENLPAISHLMEIGILLLFISGLSRLILWSDPGIIFLPQPYGWIMLAKIILYIIIVINGIFIQKECIPLIIGDRSKATPHDSHRAWIKFKTLAKINLLLVMVIVALGETLSLSNI